MGGFCTTAQWRLSECKVLTWLRRAGQKGVGPAVAAAVSGLCAPGRGLRNIFINEHFKVSRDGNQMWDLISKSQSEAEQEAKIRDT